MKRWLTFIPVILGLGLVGYALAQTSPHGYTCTTVNVTSATVPAAIITPSANITTWIMDNSVTPGSDPVLVFPYNKTLPTAVPTPAGEKEIPSGSSVADAVTCDSPSCREGMGQGWAAVLESGVTATKVRACIR